MKNANTKAARMILTAISTGLERHPSARPVLNHGREVYVTVPPSACHGCGGDGCRCCNFTGENLPS